MWSAIESRLVQRTTFSYKNARTLFEPAYCLKHAVMLTQNRTKQHTYVQHCFRTAENKQIIELIRIVCYVFEKQPTFQTDSNSSLHTPN